MCFLLLVCREESSLVCLSIKKWTGNQCEQNKFTSRVDCTESPGGWCEFLDIFQPNKKVLFDSAAFFMLNWLYSHLLFWNATPVLERQRCTASLYFDWWYLEQLQSHGQPASGLLLDFGYILVLDIWKIIDLRNRLTDCNCHECWSVGVISVWLSCWSWFSSWRTFSIFMVGKTFISLGWQVMLKSCY